ncbi:MAG: hypothetical protein J2O48_01745 [Solirubrobacterales bacterium]|nr:hypothetical protein [Solirubrobacterales bacterium]
MSQRIREHAGDLESTKQADYAAQIAQHWGTPQLPELAGSKEACEILGITKATLARWLEPGSGSHGDQCTWMIEPRYVAAGPVWPRADVEGFAREIGRKRG